MSTGQQSSVITPIGRILYADLFEPAVYKDADPNKEPKYEVTVLFSKDTDLSSLKKLAKEAVQEKFGSRIPANIESAFRKVSMRENADSLIEAGFHADDITIKFKSKYAPEVIGPRKEKILKSSGEIYPGCCIRLSTTAFAWTHTGKKGFSFNLGNVQKCRDGEQLHLSNRQSADSEFDAIETSADDEVPFDELENNDLL